MGVIRHYFTIDGVSSLDFNIWISGGATYSSPKRDTTQIVVPGRDGALTIDNGRFENITLAYPAFISRGFQEHIEAFTDFIGSLRGYKRLEDTYHPDEYRMALFTDGIEPKTTARNLSGEFDISFTCKPQRFLKSGERSHVFTSAGSIKNPTYQVAKPLIRVYGTGTVGIGSTTITISDCTEYVDIDCDIMDAYEGTTNRNGDIVLSSDKFPTLAAGVTGVSFNGPTSVEIIPRWWRV